MAQLYKGLASYQENEAGQFKGRTLEIQEMYDNFMRNEYLVCYADSGEGKSSIIEAGLIPKLRQGCYHPVRILFEDKDFKNEDIDFDKFVCDAIYKEIECLKTDTSIQVDIAYHKKLLNTNETLEWESQLIDSVAWLRLRYSMLAIDNMVFTPVLIFDQFEEVFTNPKSQEWTNRFFAWLQELSMDLCPKRIVEDIKKHVGGEFFSEISTNKLYKAIFSLRSEYIGQLDYWGTQKYYIPILKSNRYLLRPLTIEGAREVITQQDGYNGLDDVAEEIIDAIRQSQKGKNFVEDSSSDLPCIPALFLSVICSKAYGMSEQGRSAFIGKLKGEKSTSREDAINEIIEDFYNEAISACDIPEIDLEVIEDVLVNSEGVRQRISSESDVLNGISFSKNYQEKLKGARLIRVISEYNREDKIVELIHDCLCDIVLRRKRIRQEVKNQRKIKDTEEKAERARLEAEDALRRKNQTENLTSSFFLLALFLFVAWLFYSVCQDKTIFMSLMDLDGDGVVKFYNEQLLFTIIVSNLAILPILIYSAVKKLKITAWLSIYGLLSNAVLFYFFFMGQNEQMGIRTSLGAVAIGVSFVTLLYSYVFNILRLPTKDDFRILINSIPLTFFFLALSIYLFYLCIFNDALGIPDPSDSSWGILIIPLLTYELIRLLFRIKRQWLPWGTYLILLGLMSYNTIEGYPIFKEFLAMAIVLCLLFVLLWLHQGLIVKKKALAVISQASVIIIILVLNLGFNPLNVNYDSVAGVYSWKEVSVKDVDNLFGVVEAYTGDTLLPCVFDSLKNNEEYYACLSTNKIHSTDTTNYNGRYSYSKGTGFAKYQNRYLPSMEHITYKIAKKKKLDRTLTDTISNYAAKTYFESRNACISLLLGSGDLSLEKTPSLELLYKYQLKELDEILKFGKENLNSIGRIDSDWTVKFNRSFARTFFLCLLRDRIVKEDSANVFSLCQEILPLYFYDLSKNINITINSIYYITFGEFYKSYVTRIDLSNLRKEEVALQIEAWYNYIEFFTYMDISLNTESYSKQIMEMIADTRNKIEEIENNIQKQDNTLAKLKCLTNNDSLSADQVMEAIKLAVNGYKDVASAREQFKNTAQFVSERLSKLEEERVQIDIEFRNMINNVFLVLPSVVTDTPNVYNANFSNICELLYMVAAVRLYDMSSVYLQALENMDGAKMKTYIEFKKAQKEKAEMLQKIREMANNFNR